MSAKIMYSSELYPEEVIIKAAYSLLNEFYVHLDMEGDNYVFILTSKSGEADGEYAKNAADSEMISQLARYTVSESTKDIRRIMIARAFASSVLEEDEDIPEYAPEYKSSAEKILTDWFEKNERRDTV